MTTDLNNGVHPLQAAAQESATAKSTAQQAESAAAASKSAEQEAVTARQTAEAEVARLQPLLEEAKRAQERAQEQQHNAEQTLSVKQVGHSNSTCIVLHGYYWHCSRMAARLKCR